MSCSRKESNDKYYSVGIYISPHPLYFFLYFKCIKINIIIHLLGTKLRYHQNRFLYNRLKTKSVKKLVLKQCNSYKKQSKESF